MMEFRIKEVKMPLDSGELILFYPQSKQKTNKTEGYFWWKKTIEEEYWSEFYQEKKGGFIYSTKCTYGDLVRFKTKKEAEMFIEKYKDSCREYAENFFAQVGVEIKDDGVTYHPIETGSLIVKNEIPPKVDDKQE